jgi:hypothetical protein
MILESIYENKNRKAFIYKSAYDDSYTVEYQMNGRIINRSHHTSLTLAEEVADDYVIEAGPDPKLLNEEAA